MSSIWRERYNSPKHQSQWYLRNNTHLSSAWWDLNVSQHPHKLHSTHGPGSEQRRVSSSCQPETKACLDWGWPLFTFHLSSALLSFKQCQTHLRSASACYSLQTLWETACERCLFSVNLKKNLKICKCVSLVTHLQPAEGTIVIFQLCLLPKLIH